jgi:hypothetical protein
MLTVPLVRPLKSPSAPTSSDQLGDAERRGDRLDEEAVRRRRQHEPVAGRAMLGNERARRRADARRDHRRDEALAQRRPCSRRATGERRRVEAGELLRCDGAAFVTLRDLAVGGAEGCAIEDALFDQERAPEDVGVAGEQRSVEIEQRETRQRSARPLKVTAGARHAVA